MARIAFLTFGTRGDVTPLFCLAGALRARQHEVTLAIDEEFIHEEQRLDLPAQVDR